MYALWQFIRSFLHRGWWLVTSLYLVTEAQLSPLQLVALGTGQGLVVLAAEIPTGVLADTYSRKWSIVIAHVLMGLGMASTGLADSFVILLLTQMLWGLSWTFSTGADVAWLTDELNQPNRTAVALADAAKWGQIGSAFGIAAFAGVAWMGSLSIAIIAAGLGMWVLGVWVAFTFPETRFRRQTESRQVLSALRVAVRAVQTARLKRTLLLILICTFLVNGADEAFGRLYVKRLIELGIADIAEPILWLSFVSIASLLFGAASLSLLARRFERGTTNAAAYGLAAFAGAVGLLLFAVAPNAQLAVAGVLVVSGFAMTLLRTVSVIWSNEHARSDIRATVQSLLSLSEHGGEIVIGFTLALVAEHLGVSSAMVGSCLIVLGVGALVRLRRRAG